MNSINLVPKELRSFELYQTVCSLVDSVFEACSIDDPELTVADDLINDILPDYKDIGAVNAYYKTFIRPIIGTKTAVQAGFKLVKDPGVIKEWWDASVSPYHFVIEYDDVIPDGLSVKEIIDLAYKLKNERSHLISIRNPDCEGAMHWDYTDWSAALWDNVSGINIDGVFVCLRDIYRGIVAHDIKSYYLITETHHELVQFFPRSYMWGNFIWDNEEVNNTRDIMTIYYAGLVISGASIASLHEMITQNHQVGLVDVASSMNYYINESITLHDSYYAKGYWMGGWDPEKTWDTGGDTVGAYSSVKYYIDGLPEFEENGYFEFIQSDQEFNLKE